MRSWKQRLCSLLLCGAVLVSLCPTALAEGGGISYLDETGTEKSCETYTTVNNSDTKWEGGWYVAQDQTQVPSRITVTGEVHLILVNGCDLAAVTGIQVSEGNSLTIYAQSTEDGMGALNATGIGGDAGIGGGNGGDGGTITINGGTVTAISKDGAGTGAGIGGGAGGNGGNITISGGTVTATSKLFGAGIGGGAGGDGGNITISGGTVTAISKYGAGIGGGGYGGDGGKITINGGTVNAASQDSGAGIGGGGNGGDGGKITINGGTVTATGQLSGAGIGGGSDGNGGEITITGGTVKAQGNSGADIGGGYDSNTDGIVLSNKIEISGGTVTRPDGSELNIGSATHQAKEEWVITDTEHWHPCEAADCNEHQFNKSAHTPGDWIVDQAATSSTAGSRRKECTACGYTMQTETIPATGGGSSGGGSYTPPTYKPDVTQPDEGGTVSVTPTRPERGDTVTVKPKPDEGYELDSITVTDRNSKSVDVTVKPDGTYTFTQPAGKVNIEVTYKPIETPWVNPFADMSEGDWYYEAVRFAQEQGLMNGYSDGRFGAEDTLSRSQLAQILFNKEGRPGVNYLLDFSDVAGEAWYTEAIRWATSQGIVSGYGDGTFGPDAPITREQLAVMLWRYSGSPAATNDALHFNDTDEISSFALEALRWAVENGILNGYGDGRLGPQGQATRAQVAQMLKNFFENQEEPT